MAVCRSYARSRKAVIETMHQELDARIASNPRATEEELDMGAYHENIEPQVRDVVLKLRKKGYTTYGSGFHEMNGQGIAFEQNHLAGFSFPEGLNKKLTQQGIHLTIERNAISFTLDRFLSIEELKEVWEQIEATLPDLGTPAPPCTIPMAEGFRERQAVVKTKKTNNAVHYSNKSE